MHPNALMYLLSFEIILNFSCRCHKEIYDGLLLTIYDLLSFNKFFLVDTNSGFFSTNDYVMESAGVYFLSQVKIHTIQTEIFKA